MRSVEGVHALRQLRHDVNFLLQPLHETLQLEPLHPDVNKKYENTKLLYQHIINVVLTQTRVASNDCAVTSAGCK